MTQVKIIRDDTSLGLENKINRWLLDNNKLIILNISYSIKPLSYSALIHYDTENIGE